MGLHGSILIAQHEEPNHYRSVGLKLGAMDIRGEATSTLSNFYFGGESKLEYSSSFPLKAQWHYYAELGYYLEMLKPQLEASPNEVFKAQAQGLSLLMGLRWYVGREPEFLKIKYKQNGGRSIIPWIAAAAGAGMFGATISEGHSVGYNTLQGLLFGYLAESSGGVDFFIHEKYKISTYIAGRYYFQDNLDALIGTGPFNDISIHFGVGGHYLF